jgi:predicted branched-subunit amino acid permease
VTKWVGWQGATVLGIVFADAIPTHWGLGYAGVLALLGLAVTLIGDRKAAFAAAAAFAMAILTRSLPLRLNVVLGIAAAIGTGIALERLAAARGRALP